MCSCVQDVLMKWFLTKSSHILQYGNILQYTGSNMQYSDDPYCFTPSEYYQSSVYLKRLSIAQLDNGTYETLATIRYPQKNVRMQNNFTLRVWVPYY